MSFEIFRKRFTDKVDQPRVKKLVAATFFLMMVLGFIIAIPSGEDYRENFCDSHNCKDAKSNDDGTFEAAIIALGILSSCTFFICLTAIAISCLRVDPDNERRQLVDTEVASRSYSIQNQ